MQDLGTLGGNNGAATGLNDAGEIVGNADLPGDQVSHAFVWKNGVMTDLGMVPGDGCSNTSNINSKGQVVGSSLACDGSVFHAFLWENGGPMIDLNTLIPPDSPLILRRAFNINDRGEIVGFARLKASFSEHRAFLLIPCGEGDDNKGCEDEAASATATRQSNPILTGAQRLALRRTMAGSRAGMWRRHLFPIVGAPKY
jgi:probable HAF family extracellular repeat protein